jgi:tRNA 2-selenouridine synthase
VLAPLAEYRQHFGEESALGLLGEELLAALDRIQRRLGGTRHRELRELLTQALQQQVSHGDIEAHRRWIEPLLCDYYDPMYDYMLQQRHGPILFQGSRAEVQRWLAQNP